MINEPVEKCYINIHFCGQHFESDMFVDDKRKVSFFVVYFHQRHDRRFCELIESFFVSFP